MSRKLTASVIIPAYSMGRADDVVLSVESVTRQTCKPMEIIVAVDHNTELVRTLRERVGHVATIEPNDGIIGGAETRNAGIRRATGDIVVFIDDDAWAETNWLEQLLCAYDDPAVMAVGGKTVSYFPNGRPTWFPEELDWMVGGTWKGHPDKPCEVRNLIGPNMSFRRTVCDTIGYMRPELGALPKKARAGDETEFYIRLRSMMPQVRVLYIPSAVVYHKVYTWKMTVGNLLRRAHSDGYWKSRTRHVSSSFRADGLSTEKQYLRFLLFKSIPLRLLAPWREGNLAQVCMIAGAALCFGTGHVWGTVKR